MKPSSYDLQGPLYLRLSVCLLGLLICFSSLSSAEDWPTHLHDFARGGRTSEVIATPLSNAWTFVSAEAPVSAWRAPIPGVVDGNEEVNRVDYDNAFQTTVSGDRVYFGSSTDDRVYCLDLASGRIRWTFFTEGPVRLAPTVAGGRLYFGSDDGRLYCLDAKSGRALWRVRLGPDDSRLLGNGRMISRWPVRTDAVVKDGTVYCGAGVFPHEGVVLAAFNAETGEAIWKKDGMGAENSNRNGISPQGYLLAQGDLLYVPSGRDLPSAFSLKDGAKRFKSNASWRAAGIVGGSYATLVGGYLLTGANQNVAFDAETGKPGYGWFDGRRTVADGEISYMIAEETVEAIDREKYAAGTRELMTMRHRHDGREKDDPKYLASTTNSELRNEKGKNKSKQDPAKIEELERLVAMYEKRIDDLVKEEEDFEKKFKAEATIWKVSLAAHGALIGTPDALFAGGDGFVVALEPGSGKELWRGAVEGGAAGLVAANGHLLVSTDAGRIHCFRPGTEATAAAATAAVIRSDHPGEEPFAARDRSEVIQEAARQILAGTGLKRGYCLILGLKTGELAYELAKETELKIIAVESDLKRVQSAREALARSGLYGSRVAVIHADPEKLPLSNFFANLVVSESGLLDGTVPGNPQDIARTVRPLGGKVAIRGGSAGAGRRFLQSLDLGPVKTFSDSKWAYVERGALPGAGAWTHQYANEGNTSSSDESWLKAPLGVLWYGDPGPTEMINRHSQGSPPVAQDGRLFIVGRSAMFAYDAYNGVKLWEQSYEGKPRLRTRAVPGAIAVSTNGVFLATQDECIQFDPETGRQIHTFKLPENLQGRRGQWSYLGRHRNLLVGSVADDLTKRYSKALFAYDVESRELLWTYQGENISQLCIAMGDGKVFLVDSKMTDAQREAALSEDRSELAALTGEAREEAEARLKAADLQLAVALDAKTGGRIWSQALDLTGCTGIHRSHGELMMMYQQGYLVFAGASGNGHYWQQFIAGEFKERKIVVVDAETGKEMWSKGADYRIRPIVIGQDIIAEPWSYDLCTGVSRMRTHPTTGEETPWRFIRSGHHCGQIAATENLLLFRSLTTAYYDLEADNGVSHFAGIRPGCVVNMIPANGLVHIPEASAGCQCLFSIQSTVTLEPTSADRDRGWGIFNATGSTLPIRQLHLNLGAPGDRRDSQGRLWLAYPRPAGSSKTAALELSLDVKASGSNLKTRQDLSAAGRVRGSETPWLFTSGYEGEGRFSIAVIGEKDKPGLYTVRLHFAETEPAGRGERRFDIRVQDRAAASDFDIVREAGSAFLPVVREYKNVEVFDRLDLTLTSHAGSKLPPAVNAIEIVRTSDLDKPRQPRLQPEPNRQR